MQSVQLSVNRSKLDPNFEGYKVSMEDHHFMSRKLEQNMCTRSLSPNMITLQHMKVFSNDNQLFCDTKKATDTHEYMYRILETGHIQSLVYDKKLNTWDTSVVGNLDFEPNVDSSFPTNLIFTDNNIVVACDGSAHIYVFLAVSNVNWVQMLKHKVTENNSGVSLIEARILNGKLNVLSYEVESGDDKKTRSQIHWTIVKLDDIDYAESLTIEKTTHFVQNAHFETCTFTNDGYILFLSSEKPYMVGHQNIPEVKVIGQSWSQTDNIVEIKFKLSTEFSQEDVNIDVAKTRIKLLVKETTLLNGKLDGEIDENDVEICADQETNTLILKLRATDNKKWAKLISLENTKLESLENEEIKKMGKEEQVYGTDEPMEECDEADSALMFHWVDQETGKAVKLCDVTGSQLLFSIRNGFSPAKFCLRHDVDGLLWGFEQQTPEHVATFQAFGYVQASKTTRLWSGCSPNNALACIIEGNNRVLLYSQKVEVSGTLSNRKTAQKVSHVAKQHLLRVESADQIRGVYITDSHLFAATRDQIHVVELPL
ncbi:hypothetical protein CAEBREN_28763 [Caenorhabditis brenneri]|uniref:NudC domain-containing protein 1 n=1 Tax=Caenorhabditis brenneri TaxID=135651 RepID=G0P985_CAEBE|nr:hypothetical protein CAEBREN_28763 [Caenorhabditis brenneri]